MANYSLHRTLNPFVLASLLLSSPVDQLAGVGGGGGRVEISSHASKANCVSSNASSELHNI